MSKENTPGKPGTPMTPVAAERIEANSKDSPSKDDGFADRARKAAERNVTSGAVVKGGVRR